MIGFTLPDWAGYLRFRGEIGQVIDERMYSLEWLDGQLLTGRARAFIADDAIILIEIKHYPSGERDVHGLVAAGSLPTIIDDLIPQAEEYGRSIGCIGAVIESRGGWAKALKRDGYEPYQTTIRKDF